MMSLGTTAEATMYDTFQYVCAGLRTGQSKKAFRSLPEGVPK